MLASNTFTGDNSGPKDGEKMVQYICIYHYMACLYRQKTHCYDRVGLAKAHPSNVSITGLMQSIMGRA